MLIRTRCEHCQTVTEMSKVNLAQVVICSGCGGQFVAQAEEETEGGAIALAADEPDIQVAVLEVSTTGQVARHSLSLPPPPPEDWNLGGDEEGETLPGQQFAPFRPRRKELEPFLDPEQPGDDNTIFLLAGLAALAVLGAIFFVLLLILCLVV